MKLELNKYIKSQKSFGEIKLFREMQLYLSSKYICTFIAETHQQYVSFLSPSTKCNIKRELSDLWIIVYSPRNKKAKMTFLQAKFEKNKTPIRIPFNFKGDYFQYDLLSKRPQIKSLGKIKFPNTILSNALLDSVGSFGIFYFDYKNRLDFAYSTASDISFKKKANCKTKSRQLYFKSIGYNSTDIRLNKKAEVELRSTLNADCFEFGLLNLLVGTPFENDKYTIFFLQNLFKNRNDEASIDFVKFLNIINDNNNEIMSDNFTPNFSNILLINVDGRIEKASR